MNFEKLKDAARKFEQKEDWRRAIEVYLKAIQEFESGHDPAPDLSIYNRVGDLYLKANEPGAAVQAYERAADLYRDQGFLNNAIALCGKILRVNPGRIQTYLKLAHLHARKNVVIEAKKNLLEYLERMNALNQLDEAFKAMKDFADQFPGNKEIRLMLSELLRASSRHEEAKEQLEKLASDLEARGDTLGARRTLQRLQAIELGDDPGAKPGKKSELVFLDTGPDIPGLGARRTPAPVTRTTPPARSRQTIRTTRPAAIAGLPLLDVGESTAEPLVVESSSLVESSPPSQTEPESGKGVGLDPNDIERISDTNAIPAFDIEPLQIETASLADSGLSVEPLLPISDEAQAELTSLDVGEALGFEPTQFGDIDVAETAPLEGLEIDAAPPHTVEIDEPVPEGEENELRIERATSLDLQVEDLDLEDLTSTPSDLIESSLTSLDESPELTEAFPDGLEMEPVGSDAGGLADRLGLDMVDLDAPAPPPPRLSVSVPFLEVPEPKLPTIAELEEMVFDDPDNPETHRALGEALLAAGEIQRGSDELDLTLAAYENREDWEHAVDLVNELIRLDPNGVRHHQKRVELAFRLGDKTRLIDAYLELGDALMRAGALDKALAVYRRVADHEPGNQRARVALDSLAPVEEEPPPLPPPRKSGRVSKSSRRVTPPEPIGTPIFRAATQGDTEDFIDLGALVMEDEGPRDPRMKAEEDQTGDEEKDFEDMLMQFKRGIDENIDAEDFQSHYDLGVAFKEMGLLDEAIAAFQKALRAPEGRLRTSEALGAAFYEKGQYAIAESILKKAVESLGASDEEQIGLIYWLGRSAEAQGKSAVALANYQRIMAIDIGFQDTATRMARLSGGHAR